LAFKNDETIDTLFEEINNEEIPVVIFKKWSHPARKRLLDNLCYLDRSLICYDMEMEILIIALIEDGSRESVIKALEGFSPDQRDREPPYLVKEVSFLPFSEVNTSLRHQVSTSLKEDLGQLLMAVEIPYKHIKQHAESTEVFAWTKQGAIDLKAVLEDADQNFGLTCQPATDLTPSYKPKPPALWMGFFSKRIRLQHITRILEAKGIEVENVHLPMDFMMENPKGFAIV